MGEVREFAVPTARVHEIWPIQALNHLKALTLEGVYGENDSMLEDISSIAGMKLERLAFSGTQVADLSPLSGMPLLNLEFHDTPVSDLGPVRGMPLKHLGASSRNIFDLSPLSGMRLNYLAIVNTRVHDISVLADMPLKHLCCDDTLISDFRPLLGMPISTLQFSPLIFHPLSNAPIRRLNLSGLKNNYRDGDDPHEFWKRLGARAEEAELFATNAEAIPVAEQIERVESKLKSLNADDSISISVQVDDEKALSAVLNLNRHRSENYCPNIGTVL